MYTPPFRPFPLAFLATLALVGACGGQNDYRTPPQYAFHDPGPQQHQTLSTGSSTRVEADVERVAASVPRRSQSSNGGGNPQPAQIWTDNRTASLDATVEAPPPPEADDVTPDGPLLIYTAQVTLAIYDVEATQEAILADIEAAGGYASERSSNSMVLRVPAERFRELLDAIGEHGDVLAMGWSAADVSEEFRDLDTRLRNAEVMRNRLEALLDRAQTVEEALAIERELERVTLEIERIRGQLRVMLDQIAFSTIRISFSRVAGSDVPSDDFRLPFPWLQSLGLEWLLAY